MPRLSGVELTPRPRLDSHQRCPYCHDHLEVELQAAITCPACHTEHHAACLRELGRCTTLGCERPLEVDEEGHSVDPAIRRAIRQRFRQRAKRFVARNVRRVGSPDPAPSPPREGSTEGAGDQGARSAYFRGARDEVEDALERGELEHAEAAWRRLNHLWPQLPARVRGRLFAEQAALGERVRAAKRAQADEESLAPSRRAAALGDALAWGLAGAILIGVPLFLAVVLVLVEVRHFAWTLTLTALAGFAAGAWGYRESPHRKRRRG